MDRSSFASRTVPVGPIVASMMTMLQNIGLTVCNLGAGALNDLGNAGAANPAGYRPMLWMFTILSLGGLVFSALLRQRETGPHGHGLETTRAKGL